jgi:hypothetical protein
MDVSTRPSHTHRQRSAIGRALAVLVFEGLLATQLHAATAPEAAPPDTFRQDILSVDTTQSVSTDTTHEISISVVDPGKERILLGARLTAASLHLARDVNWQVRTTAGELVLETTAHELESPLAPGDYIVEASYGAVELRETVHVVEGNSVAVNFILNAGGLRVLPKLQGLSPEDMPTRTSVYALSGRDKGKLITKADAPGELLKLPVGAYRVESRIGIGNATAVTDVRIRAGKLSALEIVHHAGLARFSFVGAPDAAVTWNVRPIDGATIGSFSGLTQQLVLKPGTYVAEAEVNGETLTAKFRIVSGEEREIMLGN